MNKDEIASLTMFIVGCCLIFAFMFLAIGWWAVPVQIAVFAFLWIGGRSIICECKWFKFFQRKYFQCEVK